MVDGEQKSEYKLGSEEIGEKGEGGNEVEGDGEKEEREGRKEDEEAPFIKGSSAFTNSSGSEKIDALL